MKVLFIANLPPPVHGSAIVSQYVVKLIEPKYNIYRMNIGSKDVLSTYNSKVIKKIILGAYNLIRVIIKIPRGYDKVYFTPAINGLVFWRDIIILIFLKLKNPRASLLLHMHNKGLEHSKSKQIIFNNLTKNDIVIVLSRQLTYPYKNRVRIISNFPIGVPTTPIRGKSKITNIGYLSNYIIEKGIKTFLEIAFEFRNSSIQFKTAGKDADCTLLELLSILESKGQFNVKVNGPKYNEDKWRFLDSLDVLLFPTTYSNECSPLVLMEAMSRGVLVISYNEGGIKDMLPKDSICLVSDKEEMIHVIHHLINSPSLYAKELEMQQLFFHSNFSKENFDKEILDLFNE